jgi:hypothetical protein
VVSNGSGSNQTTGDIVKLEKTGDSNTTFQVQKSSLGALTADEALNAQQVMPDNYKLVSSGNRTIDGNTAYLNIYTINNTDKVYKQVNLRFTKNGYIYYVTFQAPESIFDAENATLNSILDSMKVG